MNSVLVTVQLAEIQNLIKMVPMPIFFLINSSFNSFHSFSVEWQQIKKIHCVRSNFNYL